MTGNFYCVPNECARIVYQKYESQGGIRYRYPGEEWVETDGDDYSIENLQSYDDWYVFCEAITFSNPIGCGEKVTMVSRDRFRGRLISAEIDVTVTNFGSVPRFKIVREESNGRRYEQLLAMYYSSSPGGVLQSAVYLSESCKNRNVFLKGDSFSNFYAADRRRNINPDGQTRCVFKVFKNEEVIHEEIRQGCPEVDLLGDVCRLSDTYQEIQVRKVHYTQRVEVVDYGYVGFGANEFSYPLLNECLNIYRNSITAAVPPFNALQSGFFTSHEFIAQICSPQGCPPPEFRVICDCDCERCPPGTCKTDCGDTICCYDTRTGRAVASIPRDNYCEGL